MLDRVRVAMSEELTVLRGTVVSRSGVNIGVGLMYVGLWPALVALLLTSSALPLSFLMLSVVLVAIIFGSGYLLRLFQTDEMHPEVERARRKEIAFGSTLMYLGAILATLVVAVSRFPDWTVRWMLIGSISAVFGILLAASKPLYLAYRDLTSSDPLLLKAKASDRELETSTLESSASELVMPVRDTGELVPRSVTEHTTRSLDSFEKGRE
jgi:hypothetical protein